MASLSQFGKIEDMVNMLGNRLLGLKRIRLVSQYKLTFHWMRRREEEKKISFKEKERRKNFVLVLDFFLFNNGNNSSSLDDLYSTHLS